MLNLANNHSFDYGATGQAETVAALDCRAASGRPAVPARSPTSRWAERESPSSASRRIRGRRISAISTRRGGSCSRARRSRRPRRRHDARGRGGERGDACPDRSRAPSRREPRRHARVRPRRGRCRRRSRARARAARPPRARVVSRPARRLQPRQLRLVPQLRSRRRFGDQRNPQGRARCRRKLARRAARTRAARRPRHARAGSERCWDRRDSSALEERLRRRAGCASPRAASSAHRRRADEPRPLGLALRPPGRTTGTIEITIGASLCEPMP